MRTGHHIIRIAHRGASGIAPENTLAAFEKALEFDLDAVELDVHATKDGKVIVMHDATLDRTTNITGRIQELTYAEITAADAGSWFSSEYKGEKVPTLSDALDMINGHAVTVVEIKAQDIAEKVVRVIEKSNACDDVVVISFHPDNIYAVRQLKPQIPTGLLISMDVSDNPRSQAIELAHRTVAVGASTLSVSHQMLSPEFVYVIHQRGINLWTWTIDDIARIQEVAEFGVDGITSNYPDRLNRITNYESRVTN